MGHGGSRNEGVQEGKQSVRTGLLLILAESRRSGLVREKAGTFSENALSELTASRTSPLLRPAGRSLKATLFGLLKICVMSAKRINESQALGY
ncbi:hypothetical protein KUIN1_02450 [Pseudomonas sp. KUIN-1]|nr:hypothetical protein KUIN1_02450 [Pseudomonas sp. KUIN-1]